MRTRLLLGVSVLWIPLAFLFDGVTVLMLPVRLGGDATSLGLVSLVGLGIGAGLQPIAGWASDRLRHRLDRRVFTTVAVVPALLGLGLLAGTGSIVGAVIGYVLVQAASTSIQAGQQTLIPEHVSHVQRGRAAGLKSAFDVGGAFVAFLVLGALLAAGNLVAAAAVSAAVLVVAVVLMLVLVPRVDRTVATIVHTRSLPPGLVPLILARFLFLFGTYAVGRFLVLLIADRLRIPADQALDEAGGLLALLALVTAAAALVFGWLADRRERTDLMVLGAVLAVAGILLLMPSGGLAGVVAGGMVMSLGTAAFMTSNWAATTDVVPRAEAGRLMAIANLGTGLAAAAAGILGPLIDAAGFAPALLIAGAASAGAVVPLVVRLPHIHRSREHAA